MSQLADDLDARRRQEEQDIRLVLRALERLCIEEHHRLGAKWIRQGYDVPMTVDWATRDDQSRAYQRLRARYGAGEGE